MATISRDELSQRIAQAQRARVLELPRLQLTTLPDAFAELTNLETLNLGDNRLAQLPPSLGALPELRSLLIYINKLEELPDFITKLRNLSEIAAFRNRISRLPESLGMLTALINLNLSGNLLATLPPSLGDLSALSDLNLSRNRLISLPDSIGSLSQLRRLDLSHNRLEQLPESIGQLTTLEDLDLQSNSLRNLPDTIGRLTQLTELKVRGNALESLPASIRNLTRIKTLDLSGQKLLRIPDEIATMAHLKYIDLSDNNLTTLPVASLRTHTRLEALLLHGNPELRIPTEVLGPPASDVLSRAKQPSSPATILDYYYRVSLDAQPLNEAKLILVGRGGVGKTSLVNRLVDNSFDPMSPQTEGINITSWMRTLNTNEDIRLHIWDFGGQEIMHATHQFFLTQRSLYLVVLSGREGTEDIDVEYWLKLITSFGAGSPVIVVMNKSNAYAGDLNRRHLASKYPCIKEFLQTDCEDGHGIDTLRECIDRETDNLEHLRDLFPSTWFAIKNQLTDLRKNFVTFDQYRDMCAELGESDGESQEQLAGYLHSLGVALNFRDDPRLGDTNVLNPRWVTEGIYKILNSRLLATQKGVLTLENLRAILDIEVYPKVKHMFLMGLMQKFELCFEFPDAQPPTFLIPELLAKDEPEDVGNRRDMEHLALVYEYEFIPEGLLARFIVRTHQLSEDVCERRWRTGVVLEYWNNEVVVSADVRERRIAVLVTGLKSERRSALAIVRNNFDHIHASFKELRVVEKVPIPGRPGVEVNYQHLLTLEEVGEQEFIPEGSDERISVSKLLHGYQAAGQRREINIDIIIRSVVDYTLRKELESLANYVSELAEGLDERRRFGGAERSLEMFVTEIVKPVTRTEQLKRFGQAVVDAAARGGAAVKPIADAIKSVMDLVSG